LLCIGSARQHSLCLSRADLAGRQYEQRRNSDCGLRSDPANEGRELQHDDDQKEVRQVLADVVHGHGPH